MCVPTDRSPQTRGSVDHRIATRLLISADADGYRQGW
jgi:hypothetical protein